MNAPIISVIMLTYNRENMVSHMIECILNQTFKDFEFIIVDNGSTDKSGEIAEEYAKKDSRIKVIHLTTSNISRGRNVGLVRKQRCNVFFNVLFRKSILVLF